MNKFNKKGILTIQVLIFGSAAILLSVGLVYWASVALNSALQIVSQSTAFSISEAGIEYYKWHLAHNQTDFQDGTGTSTGPYEHDFYDKDGTLLGKFSLAITPPPANSTVVTIISTGTTANGKFSKSIKVRLGRQSLARYAALTQAANRFGAGTEVFGPIHSNNGIRFDGLAHNIVTSAVATYDDPDHSGGQEFGVHTHISPTDPLPPAVLPNRSDVFMAGRAVSVPAVNFSGLTQTLSDIKTNASSGGGYYGSSTVFGYDIVFKTNDTFDLYKVTALTSAPGGCTNTLSQDGWGTWSIKTQSIYKSNVPFPTSSILFFEDNIWVKGKINGARLTIAAGRFPDLAATNASITLNDDLLYTNYDGTDALALITQKNINIGLVSSSTLRIDAALIAQNGRVGRYYYEPSGGGSNCSPNDSKSSITTYGMIGSNGRYGFAYTDGTGYALRNLSFDPHLAYEPPPGFPISSSEQYAMISWEEL